MGKLLFDWITSERREFMFVDTRGDMHEENSLIRSSAGTRLCATR